MTDAKISRIAVRDLAVATTAVELAPTYADDEIGPGKSVTLHFALMLENGEYIDSNFDREPVCFTVGDGNLLPGFEGVLMGLKAGNQGEKLIAPSAAFGLVN